MARQADKFKKEKPIEFYEKTKIKESYKHADYTGNRALFSQNAKEIFDAYDEVFGDMPWHEIKAEIAQYNTRKADDAYNSWCHDVHVKWKKLSAAFHKKINVSPALETDEFNLPLRQSCVTDVIVEGEGQVSLSEALKMLTDALKTRAAGGKNDERPEKSGNTYLDQAEEMAEEIFSFMEHATSGIDINTRTQADIPVYYDKCLSMIRALGGDMEEFKALLQRAIAVRSMKLEEDEAQFIDLDAIDHINYMLDDNNIKAYEQLESGRGFQGQSIFRAQEATSDPLFHLCVTLYGINGGNRPELSTANFLIGHIAQNFGKEPIGRTKTLSKLDAFKGKLKTFKETYLTVDDHDKYRHPADLTVHRLTGILSFFYPVGDIQSIYWHMGATDSLQIAGSVFIAESFLKAEEIPDPTKPLSSLKLFQKTILALPAKKGMLLPYMGLITKNTSTATFERKAGGQADQRGKSLMKLISRGGISIHGGKVFGVAHLCVPNDDGLLTMCPNDENGFYLASGQGGTLVTKVPACGRCHYALVGALLNKKRTKDTKYKFSPAGVIMQPDGVVRVIKKGDADFDEGIKTVGNMVSYFTVWDDKKKDDYMDKTQSEAGRVVVNRYNAIQSMAIDSDSEEVADDEIDGGSTVA